MTINNKRAKYNIGDCVKHVYQGYRAIIIDIDPIFQASGRFNPQALKRSFASKNPWYRLLVENSSQMTYVEECYLRKEFSAVNINNPLINDFLIQKEGQYYRKDVKH